MRSKMFTNAVYVEQTVGYGINSCLEVVIECHCTKTGLASFFFFFLVLTSPANNFSVISGRDHRFLGIYQCSVGDPLFAIYGLDGAIFSNHVQDGSSVGLWLF